MPCASSLWLLAVARNFTLLLCLFCRRRLQAQLAPLCSWLPSMNFDETSLSDAAVARLEQCKDPRFKVVMSSLIRHLHAFVRDVEPTEQEW